MKLLKNNFFWHRFGHFTLVTKIKHNNRLSLKLLNNEKSCIKVEKPPTCLRRRHKCRLFRHLFQKLRILLFLDATLAEDQKK